MRSHGKVSIVSCLHSIDTSYHIIPTVSYAPQHGHGSYFMLFVIQCLNLLANNTVALTTFHLTIHVFVGIDKRFVSHFGNQTLQTADRIFVCFGQASWHLDKKDHFRPCLSPVPKYTLLQIVKVLHVNLQKQILSNNIAQNPQFQKRQYFLHHDLHYMYVSLLSLSLIFAAFQKPKHRSWLKERKQLPGRPLKPWTLMQVEGKGKLEIFLRQMLWHCGKYPLLSY